MEDLVLGVAVILGCLYVALSWLWVERRHRRGEPFGPYRPRHEHRGKHRR